MSEKDTNTQRGKAAWSLLALLSAVLCAISLVLAMPLRPADKPSPFLLITTITTLFAAFVTLFRL